MSGVDVERWRALADAATPGPWFFTGYCAVQSVDGVKRDDQFWSDERCNDGHTYEHHVGRVCPACGPRFIEGREDDPRMQVWDCARADEALDADATVATVAPSYGDTATGQRRADAGFIAAAREAVPALCDEVTRLRAENERLRGQMQEFRDVMHSWRGRAANGKAMWADLADALALRDGGAQ